MTRRITTKELDAKAEYASKLLGVQIERYSAYGGHSVHMVTSPSRGVTDLLGGCGPAKDAANFLDGMIAAAHIFRSAPGNIERH